MLSDDLMIGFEGCLSLPGHEVQWQEPLGEVRAYDQLGKQICLRLSDFDAVVSQHKCRCLDGVLYIDRVEEKNP